MARPGEGAGQGGGHRRVPHRGVWGCVSFPSHLAPAELTQSNLQGVPHFPQLPKTTHQLAPFPAPAVQASKESSTLLNPPQLVLSNKTLVSSEFAHPAHNQGSHTARAAGMFTGQHNKSANKSANPCFPPVPHFPPPKSHMLWLLTSWTVRTEGKNHLGIYFLTQSYPFWRRPSMPSL